MPAVQDRKTLVSNKTHFECLIKNDRVNSKYVKASDRQLTVAQLFETD